MGLIARGKTTITITMNVTIHFFSSLISSNIFVGDITPESSANHYMICIRNVIHFYLRLSPQLPLVINTMGWIKGWYFFIFILICVLFLI